MPAGWSMSARLILRITVSLLLCWSMAVAATGFAVRYEMNEVFDSVLEEAAQHLLPDILAEQGPLLRSPGTDGAPIVLPALPHDEYITYQILGADGTLRLRSHGAPDRPFLLPLRPGHGMSGEGKPVYTEFSLDGRFAIQIAEPKMHRREAVVWAILLLALPALILGPVAVVIISRTVRRSMQPLRTLEAEIRERSGTNTHPLAGHDLPAELLPIRDGVSRLLQRLGHALETERRFVANAAHELRTPVAAAMAQAQLLSRQLGDRTPAAARATTIAEDLNRLGRRVEKLLELARAEAGQALRREAVALAPLLRMVAEEFRFHKLAVGRLRLELPGDAGLTVAADLDALGIVLRNLIENALLHGDPAGPVLVSLAPDGCVRVTNAGPLLPAETLARLGQPFERPAQAAPGSGLGLSIASAILRQTGATLELLSPAPGEAEGFAAVVRFPGAVPDQAMTCNSAAVSAGAPFSRATATLAAVPVPSTSQ